MQNRKPSEKQIAYIKHICRYIDPELNVDEYFKDKSMKDASEWISSHKDEYTIALAEDDIYRDCY